MSNHSELRVNLANRVIMGLLLAAVAAAVLSACGDSEPQEREFDLRIQTRALDLDPAVIKVHQGDTVTLQIDADEHGTFHLHGYDHERSVGPGDAATIEFTANATGNFPITFHPGAEVEAGEHADEDERGDDDDEEDEEGEISIGSFEVHPR